MLTCLKKCIVRGDVHCTTHEDVITSPNMARVHFLFVVFVIIEVIANAREFISNAREFISNLHAPVVLKFQSNAEIAWSWYVQTHRLDAIHHKTRTTTTTKTHRFTAACGLP